MPVLDPTTRQLMKQRVYNHFNSIHLFKDQVHHVQTFLIYKSGENVELTHRGRTSSKPMRYVE